MTAESTAVCDQQTAECACPQLSGEHTGCGAANWRPPPARKLADGYAQSAQTRRACASGIVNACGPGSPDSHRVVWGLTSRPPVSPAGFPPVSRLPAGFSPFARLPWFPFVRRSSVRSLRPLPGFRFPFGVPPVSLPLGNLHDSAAGGRFRRRWSRAARAKVTSPAAAAPLRRDPSRTADGQRLGTRRCRYRIACYERLRAQDAAAPEPTRSVGTRVRGQLRAPTFCDTPAAADTVPRRLVQVRRAIAGLGPHRRAARRADNIGPAATFSPVKSSHAMPSRARHLP